MPTSRGSLRSSLFCLDSRRFLIRHHGSIRWSSFSVVAQTTYLRQQAPSWHNWSGDYPRTPSFKSRAHPSAWVLTMETCDRLLGSARAWTCDTVVKVKPRNEVLSPANWDGCWERSTWRLESDCLKSSEDEVCLAWWCGTDLLSWIDSISNQSLDNLRIRLIHLSRLSCLEIA